MGLISQICEFRASIIMILTPLVLLPVPFMYESEAGRCAYAILIMAVYWMTEVIPMAATALLPVVLMPWLGVMGSQPLCMNYLKDTNMLFVGGLLVAVAVEKWNLHKRIALRVILLVGSKPKWLMFGFMSTTAFLSMWISNTATTAMMVPIAQAVLTQLDKHRLATQQAEDYGEPLEDTRLTELMETSSVYADSVYTTTTARGRKFVSDLPDELPRVMPNLIGKTILETEVELEVPEENGQAIMPTEPSYHGKQTKDDARFEKMSIGMMLSVAFAANIGGTATLTGTGPNLVLKGQLDTIYGPNTGINFSSWFVFAFPNMLVCLALAWFWLQLMYLGKRELFSCLYKDSQKEDPAVNHVINEAYRNLGPMSFAEGAVLVHFIILALLWLTREPEFVEGWSYFFVPGYVTDACVAITISISLFMFPSQPPNFMCCKRKDDTRRREPAPALLDWDTVHQKLAWSVVIMLGGGFALADACEESGLSADIGAVFVAFKSFPTWGIVFLLTVITAAITNVTSNVATATIFLPILAQMADSIEVNPLYLMLPVTVVTSFAFMLPVATPPNAIVFAYGHMKIFDMVKAGSVMNLICILMIQVTINTYGYAYFDLGSYPSWAKATANATMATPLLNCSSLV